MCDIKNKKAVFDIKPEIVKNTTCSSQPCLEVRKHAKRACDGCRKKKLRCVKIGNSCKRCEELGISCEYQLKRRKRGPKPKKYVLKNNKIPDFIKTKKRKHSEISKETPEKQEVDPSIENILNRCCVFKTPLLDKTLKIEEVLSKDDECLLGLYPEPLRIVYDCTTTTVISYNSDWTVPSPNNTENQNNNEQALFPQYELSDDLTNSNEILTPQSKNNFFQDERNSGVFLTQWSTHDSEGVVESCDSRRSSVTEAEIKFENQSDNNPFHQNFTEYFDCNTEPNTNENNFFNYDDLVPFSNMGVGGCY